MAAPRAPDADDPASRQGAHNAARTAVWLLGVGETIVWAYIYYIFAALLLTWERDLGWDKADLTLGLTVAILAAACVSPLAGRLIDGGYGRWVLGGGALLGAGALAALTQAPSPAAFALIWAVIGVAQGACLYEPCFMVVTRAAGAAARPAITRITLLAGLASALCFLSTAGMLELADWRTTLWVFAGAVAFVGAPLLFVGAAMLERASPDARPQPGAAAAGRSALFQSLRKLQFWIIAIAFPIMAVNHGMLLNHIMPILAGRGIDHGVAVLVASTIGPMQVAGRIVLMLLEKRVNSLAMAGVAFGGVALASSALYFATGSPALAFLFAILQGGTYGLTSILKPAITAEFLGRVGFGLIAGWLALPYLAGSALAPHLGAVLWGAGGYDLVIMSASGLAILGCLCIAGLAAAGRKPGGG